MTVRTRQGGRGGAMTPLAAGADASARPACARVLLVDDRPENLVAHEATLAGMEIETVGVRSGREALRVMLREDFAVILLDVNMPGMDGLETAAMIRQRPRSEHTPIIFLTADAEQTGLREAYRLGAVDYLLTPVDPTVLRTKVGVFVDLHRKTMEIERQGERLRRIEAALRQDAERARRSSDEFLRRMIESAQDYAIFSLDPRGCVTSWNSGAERLFLYTEREILGQEHSVLYTPEDRATNSARRQRAKATTSGRGERDGRYQRRDGTVFLGSGVLTPILGDGGELIGFTDVVRDVTDARRAQQELREADRRKDEFLAVLAHELRNPLAAISSAVEICRMPELAQRHLSAMEIIGRQAAHLSRLTDDLLDISRLNSGKIELRLRRIDLRDVVRVALENVRHVAEARQQRLTIDLGDEPLWIDGDPVRLEQVVTNLVTNAARYSAHPGEIRVTVRREDVDAVISVKDDGIGIAPEMLGRIFELFVQADRSLARDSGGLGLGLTLARHLAELHRGRISASSAGPGHGSEFTVRLPIAEPPVSSIAEPRRVEAGEPGSRRRGGRVLVVDDNTDSAELLGALLSLAGYEVRTAHDGQTALDLVAAGPPDVVLLDIGLPVLDGYEVASRIRQAHPSMTLVAISGYGQEEDRRRAQAAGFDYHLLKPVAHEELLKLLP